MTYLLQFPNMKPQKPTPASISRGFTILELMVALVVTGILAAMLLNISSGVLDTYEETTGELDSHLQARFALDQLTEDLQAAVSRHDGKVWLAVTVRRDEELTGQWIGDKQSKPQEASLSLNQDRIQDCRYGFAGVWLRLITLSPDSLTSETGARAVSYLIDRRPINKSNSSASDCRYTLFRGDVSPENSIEAGFNLHPVNGDYTEKGGGDSRDAGQVKNPASENGLVDNVIDFGVRLYVKDSESTTGLRLVFPADRNGNLSNTDFEHLATSNFEDRDDDPDNPYSTIYPEVVDIMVRVLTRKGELAIRSFESGDTKLPPKFSSADEYWWYLAEQNSHVFVRRIKLYPSGV
ncbi:MAG: hypothetical protein CMI30_02540 [Opitutae bacterium]|nr:hypothetical protein [Opitutae bacterium]